MPMDGETQRQVEHMVPVAFALLLRWIPLWAALLPAALSVVYGGVVSPRVFPRTLREGEKHRGFAPGKLVYGGVVLVMLVIFREGMFYVVAGAWALMGIGDGMANIVGRKWGKHPVPWNRKKTWEGFAAFVVFGAFAAAWLMWWVSAGHNAPGFTMTRCVVAALAAALSAGLVETVKLPVIDDNLSVPAVAAVVLFLIPMA